METSDRSHPRRRGTLYPEGVPGRRFLELHTRELPTPEANDSFSDSQDELVLEAEKIRRFLKAG